MDRMSPPPERIMRFLDRIERNQVNLHAMMMLYRGQTVAQGYWKPFTAYTPHRLFSISKSVTSLLIGILEGEGKLRLSDRIADYFPEKLPPDPPQEILETRIVDLLQMTTPHKFTTYKIKPQDDWTETFFTVPPTNAPGAIFAYDTSASHTLAALVEKLTGMSSLDFFMERLYGPLQMAGQISWLKDPSGVCQGGTGLIMTLLDLMKLAACVMRGGDQLIPQDYIACATQKQVDTPLSPMREERFGYGYQFWRTRENGFAMYGMGGQYALMLPDKDFILCTFADTQLAPSANQDLFDAFFDEIVPFIGQTGEGAAALKARLDALAIKPVPHDAAFEYWPPKGYAFAPGAMFEQAQLTKTGLIYMKNNVTYTLPFELGRLICASLPGTCEPALISAGFYARNTLRILVHVIGDTPAGFDMLIALNEKHMTIKARGVLTPLTAGFDGTAAGKAL